MSTSTETVEQPVVAASAASVGQMLSTARERSGLTIEEAATKLRLSVRQIQALEMDDASALPSATFVRGFIRNYAKLLELDAEQLLQAYRVVAPDSEHGNITLPSENITFVSQDKKGWMPYLMASLFIGLVLAGWMAYMEFIGNAAKKPAPVAVAPAVSVAQVPVAAPVPPQAAAVDTAPVPEVAPMEQAGPAAPTVSSANAKLNLTFTASSWVSVTDHDNKELFNKSQLAGSQSMIEGMPPFTIVIGNASGVQLTYNDKPVDLVPYTKANVARFTLE